MAKPDLDDGWFMLAYELVAALMVAQIPKEARIVLFEVLSQVYGPAKRESASLSPTVIAERTGLAKPNVARGVAFLLKNGILHRDGLHDYFFVKDYEAWGTPGDPLVPACLAAYAVKVPKRLKDEADGEFKAPKPGRKGVIRSDNRSKDAVVDNPIATVDALSKNDDSVIHFDNAPPISENREVVVGVEREPSTPQPVIETDNAAKPASPAVWSQRPFSPDADELRRAKELIEGIDPHLYLGQKVQYLSRMYPLEWIVEAFVRSAGKANQLANCANDLLIRWWKQGFMDPIEVSGPRRSPAGQPAPPPAPRMSAFQAKEAAQLAAMKNYVPKSQRNKEAGS